MLPCQSTRLAASSIPAAWRQGLLALGLVLATTPAAAQDPFPLPRLTGRITLDGRLDEPAWDDVPKLELTVHAPTFGAAPTESSDVYVAYDDDYLYLAGRLWDSDPKGIRSNTLYRDQYSGDDLFSIVIDTYNDYESAEWFTASPAGVRSDRTVSNDAEFSGATYTSVMNNDWNAHWDLATTETDQGWFVEMRIPFSTLGFRDDNGRVVMGMIVYRFIARKNERQTWPAIPPNWGMAFAKPSQAQRVVLEGVFAAKPVYLTPYLLGGLERTSELNVGGTAYQAGTERTNEVGGDIKYNLTSNLTLDATINTDFAQVEVDSQQVNLTRFSLFFPEKRQFFQERSSLFEFNTGGFSRLFHSRRIGLNDDGEQVRILGGLRMVGRVGTTDVGVLSMQTASQDGMPSENFGVMRLRRQVFNPFSTIGAMATSRVDTDGEYGVTAGFDTSLRLFGDEYLTAKWVATFEKEDPTDPHSLFDASRFVARWERRIQTGFSYALDFVRSGRAYAPRLGFTPRQNYTFGQNNTEYRWFANPASAVRTVTLGARSSLYLRNEDQTVESGSVQPQLEVEFKNGRRLSLTLQSSYESVRDSFLLSGVTPVAPGDYWFHEGEARFSMSRSTRLRGTASVRAGSFYDGWRVAVSGGPTVSFSKYLEVGSSYQINVVRFDDRGESLTAHLGQLRIQAAADRHLSATTLLQYSSTANRLGINARIRYHFHEGSDLWLVYNDDLNTDRFVLGGPRLPLSQTRTFMVKYTYTFIQ